MNSNSSQAYRGDNLNPWRDNRSELYGKRDESHLGFNPSLTRGPRPVKGARRGGVRKEFRD